MNTKLLIYFVCSITLICGCELGTDRAYMEMYTAMNTNSDIIESNIDEKIMSMKEAVKRKPDYRVLLPAAEEIEHITKNFNAFVYSMNEHLDKRDLKAINDGEIKSNIITHRRKILDVIKKLSGNKNLGIRDKEIQELIQLHFFPNDALPLINNKPFDDYSFENQTIARNKAILAKQKNDALILGKIAVNYLAGKIGATALIFDKAIIISSPKAPFIIKGQTFETQIFLSFPSRSRQFPLTIKVDGIELPLNNYTATPTTYGEHIYDVEVTLTNPFNGKQETYRRPFSFEVGKRCYE